VSLTVGVLLTSLHKHKLSSMCICQRRSPEKIRPHLLSYDGCAVYDDFRVCRYLCRSRLLPLDHVRQSFRRHNVNVVLIIISVNSDIVVAIAVEWAHDATSHESCFVCVEVAKLDSPGGGFEHLVFMNKRWNTEVVGATLKRVFDASTLESLGLGGAARSVSDGILVGDEQLGDNEVQLLEVLFSVGVSMLGTLDRYGASQPTSFPWKFAMLLREGEDAHNIVHEARHEWATVLDLESRHPGRLKKLAPHTQMQPYREMMSVGVLAFCFPWVVYFWRMVS
jgi:hypothetical protein